MKNNRKRKYKYKNFIEIAKKIHGDKYDYSEVVLDNSLNKLKIFCKKHKKFFYQSVYSHLNGAKCPDCVSEIKRIKTADTQDEFVRKAKLIHGDKYNYDKVVYKNQDTKVIIICPEHGEFLQTPAAHLSKRGCMQCGIKSTHSKQKLSFEEFLKRARTIHGDKYEYLEDTYAGFNKKLTIYCKTCKQYFVQKAGKHLQRQGCKKCHKTVSNGEKQIIEWLQKNNIKYIFQKIFPECKDKQPLRFDFYLPDYNICIEYQGKQHYMFNEIFDKSIKDFIDRKHRDCIKKDFCIKQKIILLEIKYNENINQKLDEIGKIIHGGIIMEDVEKEIEVYKNKISNAILALKQIKTMVTSGERLDEDLLKKEIVFIIEQEITDLNK